MGKMNGKEISKLSTIGNVDNLFANATFGSGKHCSDELNAPTGEESLANFDTVCNQASEGTEKNLI